MPTAGPAGSPVPLLLTAIPAGFPSPADDYVEKRLDFNEYLLPRPAASFCMRVAGESMRGAGILAGDILVVDRSISPRAGCVVIAIVDGEFTVKRLFLKKNGTMGLEADNPDWKDVRLGDGEDGFSVWGVVSAVVRRLEG